MSNICRVEKRASFRPIRRVAKKIGDQLQAARNNCVGAVRMVVGRRFVSDEVRDEREHTCSTCNKSKPDLLGNLHCGVCYCCVCGAYSQTFNLAAYEEERLPDGRIVHGCKHPQRSEGKGWKR